MERRHNMYLCLYLVCIKLLVALKLVKMTVCVMPLTVMLSGVVDEKRAKTTIVYRSKTFILNTNYNFLFVILVGLTYWFGHSCQWRIDIVAAFRTPAFVIGNIGLFHAKTKFNLGLGRGV